jgi:hypothetical protein
MRPGLEELDSTLHEMTPAITLLVSPWSAEDLLPQIRQTVARRLEEVLSREGLLKLIEIAALDAALAPLIARARNGDREAFDGLAAHPQVQRVVRTAIRTALWRWNEADAQDIESSVYLNLWTSLPAFEPAKGLFLAWVRGMARRQVAQYAAQGSREVPAQGSQRVYIEVEFPPSRCFEELLGWVQREPPHRALAFLFNRYVDWLPGRIAEEVGKIALRAACEVLQREIATEYLTLGHVPELLAPLRLRAGALGDARLSDYYEDETPADAISHWSGGVARALRNHVVAQGRELLTVTCELRAGPHERLTLLWSRFLRRSLEVLCQWAEKPLLQILRAFQNEYPQMTDLRPDQVLRCTKPLQDQISPTRTLLACSHEDLREEIYRWRDRVQTLLLGPARDKNLVAYAYLCGALPGVHVTRRGGAP